MVKVAIRARRACVSFMFGHGTACDVLDVEAWVVIDRKRVEFVAYWPVGCLAGDATDAETCSTMLICSLLSRQLR